MVIGGPLDDGSWSFWPSDGANCAAMKTIVCKTPSSRRGMREIWPEMIDLNHGTVSDCRKIDSVCSRVGVGVLPIPQPVIGE